MKIQVFCLLLLTINASALGEQNSSSMGSNDGASNLQALLAEASEDNQDLNGSSALNLEDLQAQGWAQLNGAEGDADMQANGAMGASGDMQATGAMGGAAWSTSMNGGAALSMQQAGYAGNGTVVSVSKPVYAQRLISQPIIKRQIIQQPVIRRRVMKKNLIRSVQNQAPVVRNRNVNQSVDVQVPAKQINNYTVVKPTVHTNNVDVRFNKLQQRTVRRPTIVEPVRTRAEARSRTVQGPATQNIRHTVIQPSVNTIRENVTFNKQADRVVNHNPVTRATRYTRRQRTQVVNAPGNQIHNRTVLKPMVRTENVNVQFAKQPDQVINRPVIVENVQRRTLNRTQTAQIPAQKTIIQPIVQNIVRDREMHHIHKPIFKRVEVVRTVKVPTNIIQKVAVVKKVKVPVRTQGKVQVFKGAEYWDTRYAGKAMGPGINGGNMTMNASAAQAQAAMSMNAAATAAAQANMSMNAAAAAQSEAQAEWNVEAAAEAAAEAQTDADEAQADANVAEANAEQAQAGLGEWSAWSAVDSNANGANWAAAGDAAANANAADADAAYADADANAADANADAADANADGAWANAAWDSAVESNGANAQGWSFGGNWSDAAPMNLSGLGLANAGFQQLNLGGAAVMIGNNQN